MPAPRAAQTAWDKPRDFDTFEPYTNLPVVPLRPLEQWLEALRIEPISAIEWSWSRRWSVGPRAINDSMWFWFASGHGWGWLGAEDQRFRFDAGDLMLIPQGAKHMICQDDGVSSQVIAVHFYAHVFGGVNLLDLLGFPTHVPAALNAPYGPASRRLAREFALKSPGWSRAMAADIVHVLFHILRHNGPDFHVPADGDRHPELPRLLPALELINQRLGDPRLTVTGLARQVCLSEVQLRKLFRRVTGMSPARFVQRRRLERACALLRLSDMKIDEIAERCGFAGAPYFFRVFKAWTHTSPRNYRKTKEL
jgi:AraC family transcriptional regulator